MSKKDPLVDRWFHSFASAEKYPDAPCRIVLWQGRVLRPIGDRTYLVELYSWRDGSPNGVKPIPVDQMSDWKFYAKGAAGNREGNEWYEEVYSPMVRGYHFRAA